MEFFATSPTGNSSVTGATLGSSSEDIQTFIDLLECSLDVGIDNVEVPKIHIDKGREIAIADTLTLCSGQGWLDVDQGYVA
ncbi:hypothetical protein PIB30_000034 [Stylosanthes scabra]|uniref:Uncharacterized protein n=1 Tax=Stylosanthes scabra TaxID=79078 RepID=A0ABU6Q1W0_9FABA|nr:hypothetical protein [Stylosanthes scabra]